MNRKIKIEALFPELCNLFGDSMNVEYLHRALPEVEIIKTPLKNKPALLDDSDIKLVYLGSMTESAQELAINNLSRYKEIIFDKINCGTIFLVTGNALELFGNRIENEDGSSIKGLGLFDLYSKRQMMRRYSSIYLGTFEEKPGTILDIVGFKSQFAHLYNDGEKDGNISPEPLFTTLRGAGRKPGQVEEGVRINNFIGTSMLGPLLVINPLFARYIIKLMGIENYELPYEFEATRAYEARVKEFKDPNTGTEY